MAHARAPLGNTEGTALAHGRRMRILFILSFLWVGCSAPCSESSIAPTQVCLQADAGAVVPNQPFVVTAASYGSRLEGVSCSVSIDGGAITLTMTGAACPQPFSTNAVVPVAQARCTVPALDAGPYTFNDGTTFDSSAVDAGLTPCP